MPPVRTPRRERYVHASARLESALTRAVCRRLWAAGWRPQFVPFPSYGSVDWVRVRGRVVLTRPGAPAPSSVAQRGWHTFLTAEAAGASLRIRVPAADGAARVLEARADRNGYLDKVLPAALPEGWHDVQVRVAGGEHAVRAPVRVIGPDPALAVVSDIDDTVMITSVPQPLLAAWNVLWVPESERRPVKGMAALFRHIDEAYPRAPVFYLSNGAWNFIGTLQRFLEGHRFPRGPIMLTDFGPTPTGWFRSGRAHKTLALRRLARDFPQLEWLLVGDDSQHDPQLYRAFAAENPGRVRAIAIRRLPRHEQARINGVPAPSAASRRAVDALEASDVLLATARSGKGLIRRLRGLGVLPAPARVARRGERLRERA